MSGARAALLLAVPLPAQVVTGGAGVLLSDRPAVPVAELHAAAPPLAGIRPYLTLSWTDEDLHPTAITAAEATVLRTPASTTGLGAGLLWIEDGGYRANSMLVSSTVVPLPIPRTSAVAIGSTLPFQDFRWSLVLKVGVRLLP